MSRLHLPHPHLADRFAAAFERALHYGLTSDAYTTPEAQEAWGEWTPTDQYCAEHSGKENLDA